MKTLATDIYDSLSKINSLKDTAIVQEHLKHIEGKNDPTTFLPLNANIGGSSKSLKNQERNFLTEDKATYIYHKAESGNVINISTLNQEIDQD